MTNYYKGISFPFRFGGNGGVKSSVLTPEDFSHLRESIYQIIFTYKNERINENHIGSNIREYIFEDYEDINTLALIKFGIETVIAEQEPRVEVLDVRVYTVPTEEGKIYIEVDAFIIQFSTETTFQYEYSKAS